MKFSERIGKTDIRSEIQIDSMNEHLRNSLWNILYAYFMREIKEQHGARYSRNINLIDSIYFNHLKKPIDEIPFGGSQLFYSMREYFFNANYLEVYNLIDFIAQEECNFDLKEFITTCNLVLKREFSAYRFTNGLLGPITSQVEINEIENTIKKAKENKYTGVYTHINSALQKISDRENPDYRNSIKESISAVESMSKIITGRKNSSLGNALKVLKTKLQLHPALEKGFSSLYGYTSSGDGIRHALMELDNLDQEDAVFMLVSCSAFINYLIIKESKIDIEN